MRARKVPTRRDALRLVYGKLRADTMTGQDGLSSLEVVDVLVVLGIPNKEINWVAREHGDLRAAAKVEG